MSDYFYIQDVLILKFSTYVNYSSGSYYFADEATVVLTTEHFQSAWENNDNPTVWTFNPAVGFKIRFHFIEFYCYQSHYSYVRIGNGLVSGQSRLLSHSGSNLPRDVTSASNTAWLEVYGTVVHLKSVHN